MFCVVMAVGTVIAMLSNVCAFVVIVVRLDYKCVQAKIVTIEFTSNLQVNYLYFTCRF